MFAALLEGLLGGVLGRRFQQRRVRRQVGQTVGDFSIRCALRRPGAQERWRTGTLSSQGGTLSWRSSRLSLLGRLKFSLPELNLAGERRVSRREALHINPRMRVLLGRYDRGPVEFAVQPEYVNILRPGNTA